MTKPRFAFTYGLVSIFADRVRLGCFIEMDRFKLVLVGEDPAVADLDQAQVGIDLPTPVPLTSAPLPLSTRSWTSTNARRLPKRDRRNARVVQLTAANSS